jgi:chromosome segregation ATPase
MPLVRRRTNHGQRLLNTVIEMFTKPKAIHQALTNALSLAVLCVLLAVEGVAQTGAAREAVKGSAEVQDAVAKNASSVEEYAGQLEKTDRSLALLSRSDGNLAKRYQSFAKEMRKLEKAQKNAASAIEKMRARETEYFTAWDKANSQIADPELRRSLAIRRSQVMTKYQVLADDLSAIGRELQPLMSHLHDLDLFLGTDPSRANLEEASAIIDESRAEIRSLKHEIASVQRMLKVFLNENSGKS